MDGIRAWAERNLTRSPAFFMGVLDALDGDFDPRGCKPAGSVGCSPYCSGGFEGRQRMAAADGPVPAKRIRHGEVVRTS